MQRPWNSQYPADVPTEVAAPRFSNLPELIQATNRSHGQSPAFTCMGKTISFQELETMIDMFARYLQHELKIKKDDRVAIMMPNILQYPVALFAAHRVGAIVVNINPLYTARELEHQLKDSGATTIIILENFARTLEHVLKSIKLDSVIITKFGDLFDFPKKQLINFVLKHIKKVVPDYQIPKAESFTHALEIGCKQPGLSPVEIAIDDIAFLQYTGGTTGVSKGAMLTHSNILYNLAQASTVFGDLVGPNDKIVTALPLYHIFSLVCNCFLYMTAGGLNILIPNPKDTKGFVKELSRWQFTAMSGVNTLFNNLLHDESFCALDFSHLRLSIGGGMAVQKPVADHWQKVTGNIINQAYGLTETSPAVTINPRNQTSFNGTIGLPIPSTDVCIKDDNGQILPHGEPGELCVKGPQVMKGYWNRDEETQQVFDEDHWFHTGDIAVMSEDGFFSIVDRKKDMILVSGFNVYPNEIEEVVVALKGVVEAAAIGIPDEQSGETVKLFVVRSNEQVTEAEIMQYCQSNLVNYKRPKQIEFVEELPKSAVGKILRRKLKTA
ncbi:AMP-binding protein [Pseudobacteriovorax antillogorgiicola]|uniref:Long-chain-fatty-acid--CoA ligase n=1 Tax=Pseudobacteriovorax antillogorgiicola TaxID=1513793 RepID=A0A1Y6BU44_9BACT|nr:AMP-binding protein [Pseudobacteriovorax antillogorgiicola]TCS52979.1 long-chain acyl-CoA synthetase [Pseudobacteriovorax antillogorgiicola]SMF27372.1 long-chain acyl-CoA synthetase [Pseudobacteriovorax antillogorgiicola]